MSNVVLTRIAARRKVEKEIDASLFAVVKGYKDREHSSLP